MFREEGILYRTTLPAGPADVLRATGAHDFAWVFVDDVPAGVLDLSRWGKGMVWVNGRCLARFWNIGPTQTAFLPGAWLRTGRNEVVILDLLGP